MARRGLAGQGFSGGTRRRSAGPQLKLLEQRDGWGPLPPREPGSKLYGRAWWVFRRLIGRSPGCARRAWRFRPAQRGGGGWARTARRPSPCAGFGRFGSVSGAKVRADNEAVSARRPGFIGRIGPLEVNGRPRYRTPAPGLDRFAARRRVPTPFVRSYTLRARPEPSGRHEAVERGPGHARELGAWKRLSRCRAADAVACPAGNAA